MSRAPLDPHPPADAARPPSPLADEDYARLLDFRTGLRRFLHWSEQQAATVGLSAAQHQLLLAIRGHRDPQGPTIGDAADALCLRHHSAVGLVDRAVAAGLVSRGDNPDDQRVVRLRLTDEGARRIAALSALHRDELRRLHPLLEPIWADLD
ncbi:MAG: MarR family winged helix-turn-helix transcriptional regulator [Egibacteraceae bacterium]